MKPFLSDDFLLHTATARTLYHGFAKPMPIIDYHCHLPADQIAAPATTSCFCSAAAPTWWRGW